MREKMPAPKGHPPYPGCEKGGSFGYLGKGEDYYTDDELTELGEGLLVWIQQRHNIWLKYYFNLKGMCWGTVQNLYNRSELFRRYMILAKEMQEGKLCTEPYYHINKADGNHGRFMLSRHHKGEWLDKEKEESEDKSITFKVNYDGNSVKISPEILPTADNQSSTERH